MNYEIKDTFLNYWNMLGSVRIVRSISTIWSFPSLLLVPMAKPLDIPRTVGSIGFHL